VSVIKKLCLKEFFKNYLQSLELFLYQNMYYYYYYPKIFPPPPGVPLLGQVWSVVIETYSEGNRIVTVTFDTTISSSLF
jgi:hypothetical protein